MVTPGLGKTAIGCSLFLLTPLYHLTEYTCSPWESKSQPSCAEPPPNIKGGTVTFLSRRQFAVVKRNRKAIGRREKIIAIFL